MRFKDPIGWAAAIGAGILTTVALMPQARGELVYENQAPVLAPAAPADPRSDDRQNLRQAIAASQKAQSTLAAEAPVAQPAPVQQFARPAAQAPVVMIQTAPVQQPAVQYAQQPAVQYTQQPAAPQYAAPAPAYVAQQAATAPLVLGGVTSDAAPNVPQAASPEVQNLSKAELMRRERVREELRNEDVLQERLEELRLRDEKRRTDDLISGKPLDSSAQIAPVAPLAPGSVGIQDQVVVAPPAERPGQAGVVALPLAPAPSANVASLTPPGTAYPGAVPNPNPGQPVYSDQIITPTANTVIATAPESAEKSEHSMLMLSAGGGITNINVNSLFQVDPRFTAGFGLGIQATDNIAVEASYSYSQFGIGIASNNPFVSYYQQILAAQGQSGSNLDSLNLNQNVFSAGMKVSLLGADSRVRPFVGGGGGYSKGFINYSQQFQQALGGALQGYGLNSDYEMSQFLGYLSTGVDVRISRNVTLGATFKFYTVLSSSENSNLSYAGFSGYNPYAYGFGGGYPGISSDKSVAGASLSESSFYTITGGATFVF